MKPEVRSRRLPEHIAPGLRPVRAAGGPPPGLRAHSPLRPLHKPASGHPQIAQGKQRDQLRRVLGLPLVAGLNRPGFTRRGQRTLSDKPRTVDRPLYGFHVTVSSWPTA